MFYFGSVAEIKNIVTNRLVDNVLKQLVNGKNEFLAAALVLSIH